MIIDGHSHSCGIFYRSENILKLLDALGVDKVVLCPGLVNDETNQNLPNLARLLPGSDLMFFINRIIKLTHNLSKSKETLSQRNEYVYHLARQHPDRIIQCYWIDPNDPDTLVELNEKYSLWRFKAIKVHQPSNYFSLNNSMAPDVAQFAARNNLSFFMHLHSKTDIRDFIQFAQNHLETNFIIAHLIGLEIFEQREVKLPNLYFDISPKPLISDKRILKAVNLFGANRVMLGSDTPFGKDNLKRNIERINRLPLSQEQKDLILGNNFQSLLSL